jgi:hypothetical protein
MKAVSLCPFPVLPLLWQRRDGRLALTVVVKATLRMVHGQEALVAGAQEPIGGDRTWPDDPRGGLLAPTDWVPEKPRADLMLVGHAYAPQGTAVEKLVARLELDGFSKALRITGDRLWVEAEGSLAPGRPARFTEMPLRDDLLPAGPGNPAGVQAGAPPVPGERASPNIEPARPGGPCTGFGPVSPALRGHGSHAGFDWAYRLSGPPPEGFDFAFFNAAPPDQQLDRIAPGSSLRLTHLSPDLPILETRLPDLRPRAFVARAGAGAPREVELRCDTLLIDADQGLAVLSFRGAIPIDADDWDEGTLGVALEEPGGPSVASRLAHVLGTDVPEAEAIRDDPSDFGPPPWPALHEDERPMDPERASPEELVDEETAASDDDFARHTAELALVDVLRSAGARPVLPFVHAASPPAIATSAPAIEAPFTSDEPPTGEAYDPRTAKPVLPFRFAPAPASQQGPASSPAPEPVHGGGPLRFPPAPPLGPTPGRFVTPSAASPPPHATVPRAPTFGGPPPPSSPGSAIPKLPPIPGKPTRSG